MTLALGEVAKNWLYPQGRSTALAAAVDVRNGNDRALLRRVARTHGGVWAVLDRVLEVGPALQSRLIGAGGVRLAADASRAQRTRVAEAIAGMVAELCSAARIDAELPAGSGPVVSFPNSRCLVRFPDSCGPVTITVDDVGVAVRAGTAEVRFTGGACGEVGLVPQTGNEFVHPLPETGEFVLEAGGISSAIALPPHFSLLRRPPTETETRQLCQALAVLAHTNPAMYEEMLAFPVRIALLERGEHRLSLTAAGLPDLVYTNLVDPLETVDLIVHEYHHLKLDLLQDTTPLLERPATPVVAPWRPDVRTADGVLHGAYVFANVANAFDPIMALDRPSAQGRRRRAAWRVAVLRAVHLLRDSEAGITEAGHELLDGMEHSAREWCAIHADHDREEIRWASMEVTRHVRDVVLGRRPEPLYMTGVLGTAYGH